MTDLIFCDACGCSLSRDEIALNKKLIGLDTEEFLCLACLAEELGVTEQDLRYKIEDFKESGCTLFED